MHSLHVYSTIEGKIKIRREKVREREKEGGGGGVIYRDIKWW